MKTAFIAAVVSAIVSAASGTAATILVTSKNIKNGTIQTVDISAKAKKALRGNRGPQGPRGIDEVTVVGSPGVVPPGPVSSEASCPAGQQPIGGGFRTTGAMTITTSAPDVSRRLWLVLGTNSGPGLASLSAVAYCAENVNVIPLGTP
jgi:hypothetical protein